MDALPERLATKSTFLTTSLATHVRRIVSDAFRRADARSYHYRVLAALREHGPLSQADLGRAIRVDRSDIVASVNELVERGQVVRRPDADDGRRRQVTLTDAGAAQLRRLDRELAKAQSEFLEPLTDEERGVLHELLTRLLAHHEQAPPA